MSRILLADDSPHAQRMGERILREEGFEVVTVTDGETALVRLPDVDPDLVMADVFLPHRSGYDLCRYIKSHPRHRHARVVLLAGLLEPVDEAEAQRSGADGVLKKPFEASVVMALIRPLAEAAAQAREDRGDAPEPAPQPASAEAPSPAAPASPAGSQVHTPPPAPVPDVTPAPAPDLPVAAGAVPPLSAIDRTPAPPAPAGAVPPPPAPDVTPAQPDFAAAAGAVPPLSAVDPERVRAAVTVALDRALPAMIDEITERVLVALGQ